MEAHEGFSNVCRGCLCKTPVGEGSAFSIIYFRHFLIIGVNGFSAAELCGWVGVFCTETMTTVPHQGVFLSLVRFAGPEERSRLLTGISIAGGPRGLGAYFACFLLTAYMLRYKGYMASWRRKFFILV